MPALERIPPKAPRPTPPPAHSRFVFPHGRHLLVTTPRHIFAWDASGVYAVFRSSRSGIVAAKEATDGSGVLAVASKGVVVLHDTKRGREHSWGLSAPEEEIRHLQYSNDARSLYLSTTSDGLVQQYSLEHSRLLEPVQTHASAPVALAVSPAGHLMLSASGVPPAVHLNNLAHNTAASVMQPAASTSPVCAAAFHPTRPDLFMLAFRDATVAAYDATRLSKAGRYATHVLSSGGEIARLTHVHRTTVAGDLSLDSANTASPIAGIAFLPSHKLRAVTAGRDGRCRIVDFANGGAVLRTWHCKAPCTTVSVLTAESPPRSGRSRISSSTTPKEESELLAATDAIAVGLIDGRVQLYNSVGLLLIEQQLSSQEEKIISVEWINGPSPCAATSDPGSAIGGHDMGLLGPSRPKHSSAGDRALRSSSAQLKPKGKRRSGLGLPAGLAASSVPSPRLPRQLTIHPDEMDASTVRRSSASRQSGISTLPSHRYDDLFSPVKSTAHRRASHRQVLSPHKNRPRLSSQTFVGSPATDAKLDKERLAISISSSVSSTSMSSSNTRRQSTKSQSAARPIYRASNKLLSSHSKGRKLTFKSRAMNLGDATVARSQRTSSLHVDSVASKHLAKVIAMRSRGSTQPLPQKLQEKNLKEIHEEADIWLTSGDEADLDQRPRRRQTKAGNLTSVHDTNMLHQLTSLPGDPRTLLISSAEEEFITARSNFSPSIGLTSVSEDVRELFPRSSSLSPRRPTRDKQKRGQQPEATHSFSQTRQKKNGAPLARIEVNAANGRHPKSPWDRIRASKEPRTKSVRKNEFVTVVQAGDGSVDEVPQAGLTRSPSFTCVACPEAKARVQALEGEVALLKGEVLTLKAILRRNGIDVKGLVR